MAFKSTANKKQMKAREKHWVYCTERGIDIWNTPLGVEELG